MVGVIVGVVVGAGDVVKSTTGLRHGTEVLPRLAGQPGGGAREDREEWLLAGWVTVLGLTSATPTLNGLGYPPKFARTPGQYQAPTITQ